jgi:hypothetical protein
MDEIELLCWWWCGRTVLSVDALSGGWWWPAVGEAEKLIEVGTLSMFPN